MQGTRAFLASGSLTAIALSGVGALLLLLGGYFALSRGGTADRATATGSIMLPKRVTVAGGAGDDPRALVGIEHVFGDLPMGAGSASAAAAAASGAGAGANRRSTSRSLRSSASAREVDRVASFHRSGVSATRGDRSASAVDPGDGVASHAPAPTPASTAPAAAAPAPAPRLAHRTRSADHGRGATRVQRSTPAARNGDHGSSRGNHASRTGSNGLAPSITQNAADSRRTTSAPNMVGGHGAPGRGGPHDRAPNAARGDGSAGRGGPHGRAAPSAAPANGGGNRAPAKGPVAVHGHRPAPTPGRSSAGPARPSHGAPAPAPNGVARGHGVERSAAPSRAISAPASVAPPSQPTPSAPAAGADASRWAGGNPDHGHAPTGNGAPGHHGRH